VAADDSIGIFACAPTYITTSTSTNSKHLNQISHLQSIMAANDANNIFTKYKTIQYSMTIQKLVSVYTIQIVTDIIHFYSTTILQLEHMTKTMPIYLHCYSSSFVLSWPTLMLIWNYFVGARQHIDSTVWKILDIIILLNNHVNCNYIISTCPQSIGMSGIFILSLNKLKYFIRISLYNIYLLLKCIYLPSNSTICWFPKPILQIDMEHCYLHFFSEPNRHKCSETESTTQINY
jgi:hypothetical protein